TARHDAVLSFTMLTAERERGGGMCTNRREFHEVTHTSFSRRLDEAALPLDQALIDRRQQQAALDAGERRCERFGLVEVRGHQFGAVPFEIRRLRGNLD